MPTGTVKWFNAEKGYGFITPDGGAKDVFVHITTLRQNGLASLNEGDRVSFEITPGRDGRTAAENVMPVE